MKVEAEIIIGNLEDKYYSKIPISKFLVNRFLSLLDKLVDRTQAKSVLEIGCADGFLTERIRKRLKPVSISGSDISKTLITKAKRQYPKISLSVENAEDLKRKPNSFDLVVACEVLEHLPHPNKALKGIYKITKRWAILSVPNEPLWRILNILRLKYLMNFGNTPGHLNHWSKEQFINSVKKVGFNIVQIKQPLPWTMLLAEKGKR